MRTKLEGKEELLFKEREDMVCKESPKRTGKHLQLPGQSNWANTSEMVEKNNGSAAENEGALREGWGSTWT